MLSYPVPGNVPKISGFHGNPGIRKYNWNMVCHTDVLYKEMPLFPLCIGPKIKQATSI